MEPPPFLNNEVVLRHLSKYFAPKDLKTFRLVSTLCRDSSRESWRSSATVKLHSEQPNRIQDFVNFSRNSLNDPNFVPISKYNFHANILESQEEFWTTCGPHIRVLKLTRHETDVRADLFFETLNNFCPNLDELILGGVCLSANQDSQQNLNGNRTPHPKIRSLTLDNVRIDISWTEFFTNFPFLQSLRLANNISEQDQILQALYDIRQTNPGRLPLTEILLPYIYSAEDISVEVLNFLLEPTLHLKRLSLSTNGLSGESNLKSILDRHGQSLEKLKLHRYDEPCMDPDNIFSSGRVNPLMLENLRELEIDSHRVFLSFQFLRYVPNLQKLKLTSIIDYSRGYDIPDMPGFKHKHCRELTVEGQILTQDLEILIKILSNVEMLSIKVDNKQFALLCGGWPKLTNLSLTIAHGSEVDDSGITGLDIVEVGKINEKGKEILTWTPYPARNANILNLKHLRKFVMDKAIFYNGNMKLGFCAGAYGIQKLPNLIEKSGLR